MHILRQKWIFRAVALTLGLAGLVLVAHLGISDHADACEACNLADQPVLAHPTRLLPDSWTNSEITLARPATPAIALTLADCTVPRAPPLS